MYAKTVTLALAGAWHVHTRMYIKQIRELFGDSVKWAYVWDENPERAKQFAELLDCETAPDLRTILNDPSIDGVICEAETCKHHGIITACARAGKDCYTDKVLAMTAEEGRDMKRLIEEAGIRFAVSHESLPVASYVYAKRLIDEGKLGRLVSIHFRRAHGGAKANRLPTDWFDAKVAGGGALIDLGIHGVSMIAHYGDRPKSVSAYISNFTGHETEDSATVMVQYASGAIATAHTDMVTSIMENNFEILGTEGILTVQGMEGRERVMLNSKNMPGYEDTMREVPQADYEKTAMFPVSQFIEMLLTDSGEKSIPGLDIDTGIKVISIVEAAYEAARTGVSQDISDY